MIIPRGRDQTHL